MTATATTTTTTATTTTTSTTHNNHKNTDNDPNKVNTASGRYIEDLGPELRHELCVQGLEDHYLA